MFEKLEAAPPDPILGLTEAFKKDSNPSKINLGVGVYKDADNTTPILESVKRAEEMLLEEELTKSYMPISGDPEYATQVQALLFGSGHEIIRSKRAATAHTPGGTGALRVAADFLHQRFPNAKVWLSEPTWENHKNVFRAAGVETASYPYYDYEAKKLAFDAMVAALEQVPEGDAVLLHACCHNPSGMDPDLAQWKALAALAEKKRFLPFFDFAYQGFGDGLDEDAAGVRQFLRSDAELIICSSFSKNFGLYNERTGAITLVGASQDSVQRAFSHVKAAIRANYSNPPAHGGLIVSKILGSPELRPVWEEELRVMRGRIHQMRALFVETLRRKGVERDFSFIRTQKGMFSFSGLNKAQVDELRETHGIYIVGSGRINVAGMTDDNMGVLCEAIATVL